LTVRISAATSRRRRCAKKPGADLTFLYFCRFVAQFGARMTWRFLWIFAVALAGLLAAQCSSRADMTGAGLAKSVVLESNVAYLRIGQVETNLADEIRAAQIALTVSNKIAGTVLDLRFADGNDLDSAKAAADLLAAEKLPLAILVNRQTGGAAETLAAELRATHAGLVFEGVSGPAGTNSTTTAPAQPDIAVSIGAEDERAFMENPYAALPEPGETNSAAATTNLLPFVDHTSEADLVRAKIKDGDELEPVPVAERVPVPPKPFIRDPVLARAVDLIKGLAVVRAAQP
jgi:hypothetical protein